MFTVDWWVGSHEILQEILGGGRHPVCYTFIFSFLLPFLALYTQMPCNTSSTPLNAAVYLINVGRHWGKGYSEVIYPMNSIIIPFKQRTTVSGFVGRSLSVIRLRMLHCTCSHCHIPWDFLISKLCFHSRVVTFQKCCSEYKSVWQCKGSFTTIIFRMGGCTVSNAVS